MGALTFLNPAFLWALPAAALPLLFHLFFRVRRRRRPFPTFMFFIASDPMLSARRRVREWLVLIFRTLAIIFAVLALAGPVLSGMAAGDGGVARVLVLDNSGSMAAADAGGRRRWDAAIEAASALVKAMRPADSAGLTTLVADSLAVLPAGMISKPDVLETALEGMAPTEATGQPASALGQAAAMLRNRSGIGGEIHVFTDLQEAEWAGPAIPAGFLPPGAALWIHRIEPATPAPVNVSLMRAEGPGRALTAGEPFSIELEILNRSPAPVDTSVIGADDAGASAMQRFALGPGETREARLAFKAGPEGPHGINVRIEGDGFEADNRAGVGILSVAARRVLLVGARAAHGFLPFALAPSGSAGLLVENALPASLPAMLESSNIACVAIAMPDIGAVSEKTLRGFVEQGGVLIVSPSGAGAEAGSGTPLPGWLGVIAGPDAADTNGLPVRVLDPGGACFREMRGDSGEVALGRVIAFRARPLVPRPGAKLSGDSALLGLEDGRILLWTRKLGRGRIFASGLAFTPEWSTLPMRAGFVVLARAMALAGGAEDTGAQLVAGRTWHPPAAWTQQFFRVNALCGPAVQWEGAVRDGFAPARAGVMSAAAADNPGAARPGRPARPERLLSVRASEAEGVWRFVEGGSVPVLRGAAHSVARYRDPAALLKAVRAREAARPLRHIALFLALAALLAEALAATPRWRRNKAEGGERV